MEIILIQRHFSPASSLKCNLPPLVGFLLAGFGLHAFGYQSNDVIVTLADLGVTLLFFTIGLKLDVKTLLSKKFGRCYSAQYSLDSFLCSGSRWAEAAWAFIPYHHGSQSDPTARFRSLFL